MLHASEDERGRFLDFLGLDDDEEIEIETTEVGGQRPVVIYMHDDFNGRGLPGVAMFDQQSLLHTEDSLMPYEFKHLLGHWHNAIPALMVTGGTLVVEGSDLWSVTSVDLYLRVGNESYTAEWLYQRHLAGQSPPYGLSFKDLT